MSEPPIVRIEYDGMTFGEGELVGLAEQEVRALDRRRHDVIRTARGWRARRGS